VGVLTGPHSAARLRAAGATSIIPSIADLPPLLADGVSTDSAGAPADGSSDEAPGMSAELKSTTIEVPAQTQVKRRISDR